MSYIIVTDDFFGGAEGFQSILNDYYENEMEVLRPDDKEKARKFIEEGLIVGGRRVGLTEGVEKERYQIEETLLNQLLDSRLIRAENTHLGKSYELSHDTLIAPILASFEKRRFKEEEQQKAAELRVARKRLAIAASIALAGVLLTATSTIFYVQARNAKSEAEQQTKIAQVERTNAQEALNSYKKAQLEGARDRYDRYLAGGIAYMAQTDYNTALNNFDLALEVLQNYTEDSGDSSLFRQIIDLGNPADSLRTVAISKSGVGQLFQQYIASGDRLQRRGNRFLMDAKFNYQKALALNYNNSLVIGKLNELKGKLATAFEYFKSRGDTFLDAEGYTDALKNYQQALRIRPNSSAIKSQIKICRNAIK